ncbi:hypothetical protein BP5796_12278 [Coleophoma crateriformis]|uniref:Uncharacterized protein n=1 Tax=Coleophoma crateriformis TaxID=565419 RepID=A0A3D8Q9Q9_9HELO|nr:hypothetical protein BP5796_12278 [Coleophoma crateriformis]
MVHYSIPLLILVAVLVAYLVLTKVQFLLITRRFAQSHGCNLQSITPSRKAFLAWISSENKLNMREALVRPSFTKHAITELNTLEIHIQSLLNIIPKDNSTFDLQTLLFQLTLDNSTDFLLGESVHSLTSPPGSVEQEFGIKFDYAQFQLKHRLRLGWFARFHGSKEFSDACKFVHAFVDKFVEKALKAKLEEKVRFDAEGQKKEKYIFLDELVQATEDPIQIRSELLNILLAGRDTTAGILSNLFFVLARRPEIWTKLRTEVDELGGKLPT